MLSFVMFSSAAGDACSGRIEFHSTDSQENSSVQRQGLYSGHLALIPSQIPFKMPLLSRFSAVLVKRITCFGTSVA